MYSRFFDIDRKQGFSAQVYVLAPDKQHSVGEETRDVWCGMAECLGWDALKSELEDLCFAVLEPERYCKLRCALDELWKLPSSPMLKDMCKRSLSLVGSSSSAGLSSSSTQPGTLSSLNTLLASGSPSGSSSQADESLPTASAFGSADGVEAFDPDAPEMSMRVLRVSADATVSIEQGEYDIEARTFSPLTTAGPDAGPGTSGTISSRDVGFSGGSSSSSSSLDSSSLESRFADYTGPSASDLAASLLWLEVSDFANGVIGAGISSSSGSSGSSGSSSGSSGSSGSGSSGSGSGSGGSSTRSSSIPSDTRVPVPLSTGAMGGPAAGSIESLGNGYSREFARQLRNIQQRMLQVKSGSSTMLMPQASGRSSLPLPFPSSSALPFRPSRTAPTSAPTPSPSFPTRPSPASTANTYDLSSAQPLVQTSTSASQAAVTGAVATLVSGAVATLPPPPTTSLPLTAAPELTWSMDNDCASVSTSGAASSSSTPRNSNSNSPNISSSRGSSMVSPTRSLNSPSSGSSSKSSSTVGASLASNTFAFASAAAAVAVSSVTAVAMATAKLAPGPKPFHPSEQQLMLRELLSTVVPFDAVSFNNTRRLAVSTRKGLDVLKKCANQLHSEIMMRSQAAGLTINIQGRLKSLYSISKKMARKNVPLEQIYDARALRVIIANGEGTAIQEAIPACYRLVSAVHSIWKPIKLEFDDYVANPKPSGYQALHTAVKGPGGVAMELQIKSSSMHELAEFGFAAHWVYKGDTPMVLMPQRRPVGSAPVLPTKPGYVGQPVLKVANAKLRYGVVVSNSKEGRVICAVRSGLTFPTYPTRLPTYGLYHDLLRYSAERSLTVAGHGDFNLRLEEYVKCDDGRYHREDHLGYLLPAETITLLEGFEEEAAAGAFLDSQQASAAAGLPTGLQTTPPQSSIDGQATASGSGTPSTAQGTNPDSSGASGSNVSASAQGSSAGSGSSIGGGSSSSRVGLLGSSGPGMAPATSLPAEMTEQEVASQEVNRKQMLRTFRKTQQLRLIIEWGKDMNGRLGASAGALEAESEEVSVIIWPGGSIQHYPRGTTVYELLQRQGDSANVCTGEGRDEFKVNLLLNVNNRLVPESTVVYDGDSIYLSRETVKI
ncbi:MAG: hypothetical protein WDW38_002867 [Sanguina aurantia]